LVKGHHADLRARIDTLTSGLLASDPPIVGLDPSVIVQPRRLHFTLGTLSLDSPAFSATASSSQEATQLNTLEHASALLQAVQPRIIKLLAGRPLRIGLETIDMLQPERQRQGMAHVLVLCPDPKSDNGQRLRAVCDLVREAFSREGLLVNAKQSLKVRPLHCTIINTRYRRPRPKKARVPFSYTALPAPSAPAMDVHSAPQSQREKLLPIPTSFGSWQVDELQLCQMGSWGPEGEYIADARCSIVP
ncbi:kinase A anchor protein, partial [Vararia minispora EC-137]